MSSVSSPIGFYRSHGPADAETPYTNHSARDSEGLQVDTGRQRKIVADPGAKMTQGINRWVLILLVAAITAVVVGGAVGGGLGGTLAHTKSESCDTPTSTVETNTATTTAGVQYQPLPPSQVQNLTFTEDCKTGETFNTTDSNGYKLTWFCGIDTLPNTESREGGPVKDLAPLLAYTVADCIQACIALNQLEDRGLEVTCRSVVFTTAMAWFSESYGANCWLKNATRMRGPKWVFDNPTFYYIEVSN